MRIKNTGRSSSDSPDRVEAIYACRTRCKPKPHALDFRPFLATSGAVMDSYRLKRCSTRFRS